MFKFLASVVIASGVMFGQVCSGPSQTTFDQAYKLAQPPQVQSLLRNIDESSRQTLGIQLALQGYTIDVPIMIYGWDPCLVMQLRQQFGYTWVPSALQAPVAIAPGVIVPGQVAYNPNPPYPPGSIKVSTNVSDYPPFTPPPPPPPPVTDYVGPQSFGAIYLDIVGDPHVDGFQTTDSRGTFVLHVVATPFGNERYYEKTN